LRQEVPALLKTDPNISLSVEQFVTILGNNKNEAVFYQRQQIKTESVVIFVFPFGQLLENIFSDVIFEVPVLIK
jgi:hypothetical protein